MTVIPPGAKLAPVDLPPPPPSADPREPESTGRRTRTPQRGARSPFSSRASSPTRGDTSPPLVAPLPRSGSVGSSTALSPKPAGAAAALHAQPQSQNQSPLSPHATLSATSLSPTSTSLGAASYAAVGTGQHGHSTHSTLSRPSSPSSIHSSGSAIFERDIEVPAVASLSLNSAPTLSHKSSRIFHPHGSNLELTVPAVLDDAVEALTAQDNVEIEAPAPTGMARSASTGVAVSPALRARVASMPPQGLMGLGVNSGSLSHSPSPPSSPSQAQTHLLNSLNTQISPLALASTPGAALSPMASLPAPLVGTAARSGSGSSPSPPAQQATTDTPSTASSPTSPVSPTQAQHKHRPAPLRQLSGSGLMPGGWAFEEDAGGATAVKEEPANLHVNPASASAASAATTASPSAGGPAGTSPGPPAPGSLGSALPAHLTPTKDKRRISFISYNDLLLSVPTQVTSLGEITSGNLSPDHLPGTVSPSVASRSPVISAASPAVFPGAPLPGGGAGQPLSQTQAQAQAQPGQHPAEWTREGLGRGLEQRLEDLVMYDK